MTTRISPTSYWALPDRHRGPPVRIELEQAKEYNHQGYGIFWTVNPFNGPGRTQASGVYYWFSESDDGSKQRQLVRVASLPLRPSCIVESKRGFHWYWRRANAVGRALDSLHCWDVLVKRGLCPAINGDPKATDPLRLLRVPGFYHHKSEPFLVRTVWETDAAYTEEQMLEAFPAAGKARRPVVHQPTGDSFWTRADSLHAGEAIIRLNGHWLQNGEHFELREQANGNLNIYRTTDSYSTGCWVRSDGSLGGVAGGPCLKHWLAWYGHSWGTIRKGLLEVFPEWFVGVEDVRSE